MVIYFNHFIKVKDKQNEVDCFKKRRLPFLLKKKKKKKKEKEKEAKC